MADSQWLIANRRERNFRAVIIIHADFSRSALRIDKKWKNSLTLARLCDNVTRRAYLAHILNSLKLPSLELTAEVAENAEKDMVFIHSSTSSRMSSPSLSEANTSSREGDDMRLRSLRYNLCELYNGDSL